MKNKPEKIFIFIALFWSILFIIFNPPFQACDEDAHLYKMYGMSQGSFNFKKFTVSDPRGTGKKLTFTGQILPSGLVETARQNRSLILHPQLKTSFSETYKLSQIKLKKEAQLFIGYPPPAYGPLSYFPSVLAVWLLSLFNAAPLLMMYAARLCSLFIYLPLVYFAIKITPVKKWLFLALGALPMALYSAGAVSADGLLNGLSLLFCAFVLYLAYDKNKENIEKRDIVVLNILFLLIILTKFTYFPLFLLFLLIPCTKFSDSYSKVKVFWTAFIINLLILTIYLAYNMSLTNGIQMYSIETSPSAVLKNTLLHPLNYLFTVLKTTVLNFKEYLNHFIGIFGWEDTTLPLYVTNLYTFILICAGLMNFNESSQITVKDKLIIALSAAGCYFAVLTACWIVFMPNPLNHTVTGVQGRYFIPFALLIFLLFSNKKMPVLSAESIFQKVLIFILLFGINFVLFVSLIRLIYRFYV